MTIAPKLFLIATFVPAVFLSACSDKSPEEALNLLEANQFSQAAALARKELEDKPQDPFYHGVVAEVLTEQCVRGNCPASTPEKLSEIREHLSHIKKPITLDEGRTINVYNRLAPIVERFISVHNATKSYAMFVERALPEGVNKRHFLREIEGFAKQAMARGDFDGAVELLKNVTELGNPDAPTVVLSKFMLAFIQSEGEPSVALQAEVSDALAKSPKEKETFITNMPHLAIIKARRETETTQALLNTYTDILTDPFTEMNLKQIDTEDNRALLATEIFRLSRDETYLNQFVPADMAERDTSKIKAELLKVALLHDPQNTEIWDVFFPLALENMADENGSLRFVYNNLDLTRIPTSVVINNNEVLLAKAREALKNREDISPYLQEIIYRRDANQADFDEAARGLLDQALTRALARNDYQQAVNYLRLMPDPPEDKKEELIKTLEGALAEFWAANEFRRMEEVTQYMRQKLNTSINLDVELMSFLREYLESDQVKDKLRATTPEPLLLSAEEARTDLGPKMEYALQRFQSRPEIIQARLKALAINLEGAYSTANVLHSLRHLFTDENLDELVTNALKSALVNDESLGAVEMASYGEQFMETWPEFFTINFVVGESLKRVKSVDEAQEVWGATSEDFHEFAAKLRPQLVNLLRGIELFEAGNRAEAAEIFASITDPVYQEEARPYLDEYGSLVQQFRGSYFYQGTDPNSPVAVLYIEEGDELLTAQVTAISHLGVMERTQRLVKDRGRVSRVAFPARYSTQTRQLTLQNIDDVISGLTTNEARVLSTLSHLTHNNDMLYLHLNDGTRLPFAQANAKPDFTPLPKGMYGITQKVHTVQPESHVLPVGSILEFETDRQTARQDIEDPILDQVLTKSVHPLSGTIRHPATGREITLTGFFDRGDNLLHFEYEYNFDGSETIFNALVRCQPLGARITCAGHNAHEKRKRFMTVMTGRKVE